MRKSRQPRRIAANFSRCAANGREAAARYLEFSSNDFAARAYGHGLASLAKRRMASS
jgi:hypothetical protein